MAYGIREVVTVPAATASGTVEIPVSMLGVSTFRAFLVVSDVSGTNPTLDIDIEDSLNATNFNSIVSFTQATEATNEVKTYTTPFGDSLRLNYTIGGTDTPTFTFVFTIVVKD